MCVLFADEWLASTTVFAGSISYLRLLFFRRLLLVKDFHTQNTRTQRRAYARRARMKENYFYLAQKLRKLFLELLKVTVTLFWFAGREKRQGRWVAERGW